MSRYSNCPYCLRTVQLDASGRFKYHVPDHWEKTCKGKGQKAKWVEDRLLLASARNPDGDCMKCGTPISEGPKEGCDQCGPENWVRVEGNYQPTILE